MRQLFFICLLLLFAKQTFSQNTQLGNVSTSPAVVLVRAFLVLAAIIGGLLVVSFLVYRRKKLRGQIQLLSLDDVHFHGAGSSLDELNHELEMKNRSLELLNKKLVNEISQREAIERSSFARDRFLATMSYEMRTPLNVITGLTHLLLDNHPRPDQAEQLRTLQFAANELVVFINDVLDFSKIEAGKLDLQNREFDFSEIVNDLFKSFTEKAEKKGLLFYYSLDSEIPKKLMGDDARVYQILCNLLNNCLETTTEGMIRAEIFLQELQGRDAIIRFVIEGTDGGVKRDLLQSRQKKWSEIEHNFDNLDVKQLSLAITNRLVELQNGRIEVENIYGEATRFTVLMPFKAILSKQDAIIQLDLSDHSHLSGNRILLAEDNKINQLVVAKMLQKHGMNVVTADNGLEALEQMEMQDFDLVLMDIQMPEMDGYRATSEIRNLASPTKSSVPIIALTSSAFLTEKEKAVLFGMNDHVGKPFSPEELLEKISACLALNGDVRD